LNDGGSIDNGGNQGSVNDWWLVNDNWCRSFVLNWGLNSNALRFRGSLNRYRRSLDLSGSLSLDWN
jgi:hypothetical protein